MITIQQVREVHLELTTKCNASCPLCPRNFFGYPLNAGYPITELSLTDVQKIFSSEFIAQLAQVKINGNLGDFMLAQDSLEIVEYFRSQNSTNLIDISTNGSARNVSYWQRLAASKPRVRFALDGFEDTHSLYRRDTNFNTIIKNAMAFIDAGGDAVWKMVLFDHNKHQVEQARETSQKLGFAQFELVDHGRNIGPVFSRDGTFEYNIGKPRHVQESVVQLIKDTKYYTNSRWYFRTRSPATNLDCQTLSKRKTIYVAADGSVYPCCWTGFYPRTFDTGLMQGNERIKELLGDFNNNALTRPLEECLEWFTRVQKAWEIETYEQGRPFICDRACSR